MPRIRNGFVENFGKKYLQFTYRKHVLINNVTNIIQKTNRYTQICFNVTGKIFKTNKFTTEFFFRVGAREQVGEEEEEKMMKK